MKFTFAFVLIALFVVFAVSQALPQPEQAAASSNDGASAITKIVLELTPEQAAAVQKMGGRGFWPIMMKSVKKVMAIGCDLIDCEKH